MGNSIYKCGIIFTMLAGLHTIVIINIITELNARDIIYYNYQVAL